MSDTDTPGNDHLKTSIAALGKSVPSDALPVRTKLASSMDALLTEDDLHQLAFNLLIDTESMNAPTKRAYIRNLILHCLQTYRAEQLIRQLRGMRPEADWPSSRSLIAESTE